MKKTSKKKKKDSIVNIILVLVLFAGLSLLLYPIVSNWWNSFHQTRAISNYEDQIAKLDPEKSAMLLKQAQEYNENLVGADNKSVINDAQRVKYNDMLNVAGDGIMGYIEIPSIQVSLAVYHGTSEEILQFAVGHLEWSSLPVGGESTHSVLSGHRGLPSAKLFTNIDRLQVGDTFMLHVLNDVLTYEVDQILIVEPKETNDLQIEKGQDLCTLVTCTPYGVNSHRLLVRGHRVATTDLSAISSEATVIDPMIIAPIIAVPALIILLVMLMLPRKRKER